MTSVKIGETTDNENHPLTLNDHGALFKHS